MTIAGTYDPRATFYIRPWTAQYTSWYPRWEATLEDISRTACNETLQEYRAAYDAPVNSYTSYLLLTACYRHEACTYGQLTEDQQLSFQSSLVLLGLVPSLLSSIGPNIADIIMLSSHRPVLAFILSLGAPAILPSRILEYSDPHSVIMLGHGKLTLRPQKPWIALAIGVSQYICSLVAAANVLYVTIDMGRKSIVSWSCTGTFLPVVWVLLASSLHLFIILGHRFSMWRARRGRSMVKSNIVPGQPIRPRRSIMRHPLQFLSSIPRKLMDEFRICANRDISPLSDRPTEVPLTAIFLNTAAGGLAFVHILGGTAVFSSLQFVSMANALDPILWRLVLSALACRLVLVVELAGLRALSSTARITSQDHEDVHHHPES